MKKKKRDWNSLPECDVIDNYIIDRLKKGLQTNILITGLRGKGKSSFGCRMGERLTEKINNGKAFSSDDIIDSFLKFLERLQKVDRPGEVFMIEEVSVLFSSKRSMTGENVSLGKILDVIRKKQVIMISNAPLWPSVDSHMRAMTDILVECKGVLRDQKVVVAKAWKIQTNTQTGKTYRHTFMRDKRRVRLFYSKQSNQEIWAQYEKDKDNFIDELIHNIKKKIEIKLVKENVELNKYSAKGVVGRQKDIIDCWEKGIFNQVEIAKVLGITQGVVSDKEIALRKKGIFKESYKKAQKT